jgi:hypothetical protein
MALGVIPTWPDDDSINRRRLPTPPHPCTFALLACQARPCRLADVDGGRHALTIQTYMDCSKSMTKHDFHYGWLPQATVTTAITR